MVLVRVVVSYSVVVFAKASVTPPHNSTKSAAMEKFVLSKANDTKIKELEKLHLP